MAQTDEERRARARDYQRKAYAKKRKERDRLERLARNERDLMPTSTPQDRAAKARATWAAKRLAERQVVLAEQVPDVQVATQVAIPDDIHPGILGAGSLDNGVPPIPTGASLVAEVMASFRKLAISVKEAGATQGVFLFPDGTTFTVRSDGSVAVS